MKIKKSLALVSVTLWTSIFASGGFASPVFADSQSKFEIWTGSLFSIGAGNIAGTQITNLNFLGAGLTPGIAVGVPSVSIGYILSPKFEIIFSPNFNFISRSGTLTTSSFSVGLVTAGLSYNISGEHRNAYFARAEGGVAVVNNNTVSENYPAIMLQAGKRFSLTESISYTPSVSLQYLASQPSLSIVVVITPVQFSLFL